MTSAQILSILKHYKEFSPLLKKIFLVHCDHSYIRFIIECIVNILEGNLPIPSLTTLEQFESILQQIVSLVKPQESYVAAVRSILISNQGVALIDELHTPILLYFGYPTAATHLTFLAHFILFKPILQRLVIRHCKASFIIFLLECVVNTSKGHKRYRSSKSVQKQYSGIIKSLSKSVVNKSFDVQKIREILVTREGLEFIAALYSEVRLHLQRRT